MTTRIGVFVKMPTRPRSARLADVLETVSGGHATSQHFGIQHMVRKCDGVQGEKEKAM